MIDYDRILLPNGKIAFRVSATKYRRYENIRNYILRTHYERGISLRYAKLKAMCLFDVDEKDISTALNKWKSWYFVRNGACIRHRPIELFIEDHKEKADSEKRVKDEIKRQEKIRKELKVFYADENGQVTINTNGVD